LASLGEANEYQRVFTTLGIEKNGEIGIPKMDQDEWEETLKLHRKAQIEKLRAVNRKDLSVNKEHHDEIKRAAQGIFWTHSAWKPEPPTRWTNNRNREYGHGERRPR
jgi:hypothetical protein